MSFSLKFMISFFNRIFSLTINNIIWLTLLLSCYTSNVRANFLEGVGDVVQIANTVVGAAIAIKKKDKEGLVQLGKVTVVNLAATYAFKYSLNNVSLFGGERLGLRPNGADYNFPSGHTSLAFSGAWFIQKRYGIKYSIAPIVGAFVVGYSRVDANKHDFKAVLFGGLIGILSAELFTRVLPVDSKLSLALGADFSAINFKLKYYF